MSQVQKWKLVRVLTPEAPNITPMEIHISPADKFHVIGSKKANFGDTLLASSYVSRKHCQLEFKNKYWYLKDNSSLNGTFLNSERIDCERELRENDVIGLGIPEYGPTLAHPLSQYYIFKLVKYIRLADSETAPTDASSNIPLITLDDEDLGEGPVHVSSVHDGRKCSSSSAITTCPEPKAVPKESISSAASCSSGSTSASTTVVVTPTTDNPDKDKAKPKPLSKKVKGLLISHFAERVSQLKQQRQACSQETDDEEGNQLVQQQLSTGNSFQERGDTVVKTESEESGADLLAESELKQENEKKLKHQQENEEVERKVKAGLKLKKQKEEEGKLREAQDEQKRQKEVQRKLREQEEEEKGRKETQLKLKEEQETEKIKTETQRKLREQLEEQKRRKEVQRKLREQEEEEKREKETQQKLKEEQDEEKIKKEAHRKLKEEQEVEKRKRVQEEKKEREKEVQRRLRKEEEEKQNSESQRMLEQYQDEKHGRQDREGQRKKEAERQPKAKKLEDQRKEDDIRIINKEDEEKERKRKSKEQDGKEFRKKWKTEGESEKHRKLQGELEKDNRRKADSEEEEEKTRGRHTDKSDKDFNRKSDSEVQEEKLTNKNHDARSSTDIDIMNQRKAENARKVRRLKAMCVAVQVKLKPVVSLKSNGELLVKDKKGSISKTSLKRIKKQFLESSFICKGENILRKPTCDPRDGRVNISKKKRRVRDGPDQEEAPSKKMRNTEQPSHSSSTAGPSSSSSFAKSPHMPSPVTKSATQKRITTVPVKFWDSESSEDTTSDVEVADISPKENRKTTPQDEDEESKLNKIRALQRHKLSQSARTVKVLDTALPIRKKRSQELETYHSPSPQSSARRNPQPSSSSPVQPQGSIRERLRQIEIAKRNKKIEEENKNKPVIKAPAPVEPPKIKMTKRSRSDMLLQNVIESTQAQAEQPPRKLLPPPTVRPDTRSAADERMPLERIISSIENNRLSQVIEKPRRPPIEQQVGHRDLSKGQANHLSPTTAAPKTGSSSNQGYSEYEVRLANSLGTPPILVRDGQSVVQLRPTARPTPDTLPDPRPEPTFPQPRPSLVLHHQSSDIARLPDDAVFKDMFTWSPTWLDEHSSKSLPVTGDRLVTTNLPAFKDYESYISVFYPLMLLELWASIAKDYSSYEDFLPKPFTSRPYFDRSAGKLEYSVGVDHIESMHNCPVLNYQYKASKKDCVSDNKYGRRPYWHCFYLTALAQKRGEFNRDRNFGIISFDVRVGMETQRKSVFCLIFTECERYEEIVPATIFHKSLTVNSSHKFKYTISIATYLNMNPSDIIMDNPAVLKKVSYIGCKLRDFKALSMLPNSKLFASVLQPPLLEQHEIFNPNESVNQAYFVTRVYESLNSVQRGIVAHISRRLLNHPKPDIMLLHGPPGTGKTKTIVALLLQLTQAKASKNNQKLLVCTPSNTAIDEIIERYVEECKEIRTGCAKIVRVGSSGKPSLAKYSLDEVAKKYCAGASVTDSLQNALKAEDRNISLCKQRIEKLKEKNKTDKSSATALQQELHALKSLQKNRNMYAEDLKKHSNNRTGMEKGRYDAVLKSQIIFSTLNSCTGGIILKLTNPKRDAMKFTCCIVDEATQATEPESLTPLLLGCEKLLLVGDPNQLPATVLSIEAENRKFRQSLFTRLYNFYNEEENRQRSPVMMLTTQYRMHPEILAWPNQWFYDNKLETSSSVLNDNARDIRVRPYLFLNMSSQEDQSDKGQISNTEEVNLIREILLVLQHQSNIDSRRHADLNIGIITPYNDQKKKINYEISQLKASSTNGSFWNRIEVDTVDSYQGREKDIILLSCVRTDDMGFLKTRERLNVSITRAKMSLIILGNAPCLNNDLMWKSLMDNAAERDVFKRIPSDYKAKGTGYLKKWIESAILK